MGQLPEVIASRIRVWACFSLRSYAKNDRDAVMSISMCVSSEELDVIHLIVRNGNFEWRRDVRLQAELVYSLQMFRILWLPEKIKIKDDAVIAEIFRERLENATDSL